MGKEKSFGKGMYVNKTILFLDTKEKVMSIVEYFNRFHFNFFVSKQGLLFFFVLIVVKRALMCCVLNFLCYYLIK